MDPQPPRPEDAPDERPDTAAAVPPADQPPASRVEPVAPVEPVATAAVQPAAVGHAPVEPAPVEPAPVEPVTVQHVAADVPPEPPPVEVAAAPVDPAPLDPADSTVVAPVPAADQPVVAEPAPAEPAPVISAPGAAPEPPAAAAQSAMILGHGSDDGTDDAVAVGEPLALERPSEAPPAVPPAAPPTSEGDGVPDAALAAATTAAVPATAAATPSAASPAAPTAPGGTAPADGPPSDDATPDAAALTPSRDRSRLLLAVLGVLALALLAGTAYLAVRAREAAASEDARREALTAARDAARVLFSYDHETLEADFERGRAVTTGEFAEEYQKTTTTVVKDVATQYKAVVQADVVEAGVVRASPDEVTTVVFLNQLTTSTRVEGQKVDQSRVRMRLVERDGRWLVAEVDAL